VAIPVKGLVAAGAQGDQGFRAVVPKLASRLDMMDLQVLGCAAILAAPVVSGKNLPAESFVRLGIQS